MNDVSISTMSWSRGARDRVLRGDTWPLCLGGSLPSAHNPDTESLHVTTDEGPKRKVMLILLAGKFPDIIDILLDTARSRVMKQGMNVSPFPSGQDLAPHHVFKCSCETCKGSVCLIIVDIADPRNSHLHC